MAKTRTSIPKAVREAVLKEFNYRCAKCGADDPQVDHIDENPSHNDPMNLIPLCPNCHLIDHHSPTKRMEPEKLALFRRYKDPTILEPQFHPLYIRLQFLDQIDNYPNADDLDAKAEELVAFVTVLQMGAFYAKKIEPLVRKRPIGVGLIVADADGLRRFQQLAKERADEYREQLTRIRDEVYGLAVEMLRYQLWESGPNKTAR